MNDRNVTENRTKNIEVKTIRFATMVPKSSLLFKGVNFCASDVNVRYFPEKIPGHIVYVH